MWEPWNEMNDTFRPIDMSDPAMSFAVRQAVKLVYGIQCRGCAVPVHVPRMLFVVNSAGQQSPLPSPLLPFPGPQLGTAQSSTETRAGACTPHPAVPCRAAPGRAGQEN